MCLVIIASLMYTCHLCMLHSATQYWMHTCIKPVGALDTVRLSEFLKNELLNLCTDYKHSLSQLHSYMPYISYLNKNYKFICKQGTFKKERRWNQGTDPLGTLWSLISHYTCTCRSSKNSMPLRNTPVAALTHGQPQHNGLFYEQHPVLPTANEGRGRETQQTPQQDQSTSASKLVGGINLSLSPQPSSEELSSPYGKMVHETFHTKPPKVTDTNTISIVETHQPQSAEPKTTPPNISAVGRAKLPNKPSELAIAIYELDNEPKQENEAKGGSTGGNTGEQSFALAETNQNEHSEACEDTTQTTTVCLEDIDSVIRTSKNNPVFVDSPNYQTAKRESLCCTADSKYAVLCSLYS